MLSVTMLLVWSAVATGSPTPFVCGDADGSGSVTVTDGVRVLAEAADLGGACASIPGACDVDGDGRVTVTDGVAVLRTASDLPAVSRCASPVSGDESVARTSVDFSGCGAVTAETRYCLTFAQAADASATTLAVLGLDSGALCDLFEVAPELGTYERSGSIGWRGEILYVCTEAGLIRMSLLDGQTERLSTPCTAAAANDDAIFVMRSFADASFEHPPGEVVAYASEDDLRADHAANVYELRGSSRLAATADRLYGAWHSTHMVDRFDLATGAALDSIELEGYADWVNGFSVLEDGSLVVNKFVGSTGVTIFDADTGARTGVLSPARALNGLACVAHP
jgi:hypothetical protein